MRYIFILLCSFFSLYANAQNEYSIEQLLSEKANISVRPEVQNFKESGDTTYAIYGGGSVEFIIFTYYIEGSHPILNPNPTGLIINNKVYDFYCSSEQSVAKYLSVFLDIYEFDFLGRKYLCFFAFREDCLQAGCRFRCFNVYDITDPKNILPYSFASVYEGMDAFGDFNQDGQIDFISGVPKSPQSFLESETDDVKSNILFTLNTFKDGEVIRVEREDFGNPYFIYVTPKDENISKFEVISHDWFINLNDPTGKKIDATPFYPPYKKFDPKNDFLYNEKGHRVDKRNYVIHLTDFNEIEGAEDFMEELKSNGFRECFIQIDQYGPEMIFQVLYGNYWSKDKLSKILDDMIDKKVIDIDEIKLKGGGKIKHLKYDF